MPGGKNPDVMPSVPPPTTRFSTGITLVRNFLEKYESFQSLSFNSIIYSHNTVQYAYNICTSYYTMYKDKKILKTQYINIKKDSKNY